MYAVTSPDGVLIGVRPTKEEANALVFEHLLASRSEGIEGYIDPLFSFVDHSHLTSEELAELERLKSKVVANYTIEVLSGK